MASTDQAQSAYLRFLIRGGRALWEKDLKSPDADLGDGHKTREQRVKEFADNPDLGLKAEAEKLTEAALNSATAARRSARMALFVVIASIIAFLVALIAALVISPW